MARPSRTRRMLKWTAIGMCVLIPVSWIVSALAGVRIVTPVGSIAIYRGMLEIVQSPPMAVFIYQSTAWDAQLKRMRKRLREAEAMSLAAPWDHIYTVEDAAYTKARRINRARLRLKEVESDQAANHAYFGIPIATAAGQSLGIIWLKPDGPRLSRDGLGLRLPTYIIHSPRGYWPGAWIPLWLIALVATLSWVIIRRFRRPIPLGHCTNCGYDLTGNTSGVCSECGLPKPPPAIV